MASNYRLTRNERRELAQLEVSVARPLAAQARTAHSYAEVHLRHAQDRAQTAVFTLEPSIPLRAAVIEATHELQLHERWVRHTAECASMAQDLMAELAEDYGAENTNPVEMPSFPDTEEEALEVLAQLEVALARVRDHDPQGRAGTGTGPIAWDDVARTITGLRSSLPRAYGELHGPGPGAERAAS
ncbi:hypothetical protein ACQBAT_06245 [Ornithinimicrobium sp. Y1847]|uniref:hypothetical protein n=1 Tax=Ornithinimicrobium sp. Y1847 TaxID=3405419 RepID=UPI003B670E43